MGDADRPDIRQRVGAAPHRPQGVALAQETVGSAELASHLSSRSCGGPKEILGEKFHRRRASKREALAA